MARGNQREKAREKAQKEASSVVRTSRISLSFLNYLHLYLPPACLAVSCCCISVNHHQVTNIYTPSKSYRKRRTTNLVPSSLAPRRARPKSCGKNRKKVRMVHSFVFLTTSSICLFLLSLSCHNWESCHCIMHSKFSPYYGWQYVLNMDIWTNYCTNSRQEKGRCSCCRRRQEMRPHLSW